MEDTANNIIDLVFFHQQQIDGGENCRHDCHIIILKFNPQTSQTLNCQPAWQRIKAYLNSDRLHLSQKGGCYSYELGVIPVQLRIACQSNYSACGNIPPSIRGVHAYRSIRREHISKLKDLNCCGALWAMVVCTIYARSFYAIGARQHLHFFRTSIEWSVHADGFWDFFPMDGLVRYRSVKTETRNYLDSFVFIIILVL